MRKKIKLKFEDLEGELNSLSFATMQKFLGGQGGGINWDDEVSIVGGTITNHGTGVFYRGDDGTVCFFADVQISKNSFNGNSAYQANGTIYIGEDWLKEGRNSGNPFDVNMFAHEYGHHLQQQEYGNGTYWVNVATASFISASWDSSTHMDQWYEKNASKRGDDYLREYGVQTGTQR